MKQKPWGRVLVYQFDETEVTNLGRVAGFACDGYATVFRVSPENVPDEYLLEKHLPRSAALEFKYSDIVYFYVAPRDRVVEILNL